LAKQQIFPCSDNPTLSFTSQKIINAKRSRDPTSGQVDSSTVHYRKSQLYFIIQTIYVTQICMNAPLINLIVYNNIYLYLLIILIPKVQGPK